MMRGALIGLVVLTAGAPFGGVAAPAHGFRGNGSGVFAESSPPVEWGPGKNIIWQTKLPTWSNASPVPAGDRVFVCSEPCVLICVNAADGSVMWQATNDYAATVSADEWARVAAEQEKASSFGRLMGETLKRLNDLNRSLFAAGDREKVKAEIEAAEATLSELKTKWEPTPLAVRYAMPPAHGATGYSTATPVSDGTHVWSLFGNGVAACHTVAGERRWIRLIDKTRQGHGHAASPLLADGKLIVAINDVRALDPSTGADLWQAPSGSRFGTPVPATVGGVLLLVTANGEVIRASDGKTLAGGLGGLNFNSPVVHGDVAVFYNDNKATAWRLPDPASDPYRPEKLWETDVARNRHYASPVVAGGLVFGLGAGGELAAVELASGAKVIDTKLKLNGTCYSSLAAADGKLFAFSEGGSGLVLSADRERRELSSNTLEGLRSSPCAAGKRLYVRGMNHLYCLGVQ